MDCEENWLILIEEVAVFGEGVTGGNDSFLFVINSSSLPFEKRGQHRHI